MVWPLANRARIVKRIGRYTLRPSFLPAAVDSTVPLRCPVTLGTFDRVRPVERGGSAMHEDVEGGRAALEQLTAGRVATLNQSAAGLERLARIQVEQFKLALAQAQSQRQRLAIGAVWAWRLAETATTRDDIDAALFRFAQHLRAAGSSSATDASQRPALDAAARETFRRLRRPPREFRESRPLGAGAEIDHWADALGIPQSEWLELLEKPERAIRRVTRRPAEKSAPEVPYPPWLSLPPLDRSSSRLALLAPWDVSDPAEPVDLSAAARAGYRFFVAGDYQSAAFWVRPVQSALGTKWGPDETVDGRALFAWLRAVSIVEVVLGGAARWTGHHVVSAVELLHRISDAAVDPVIEALLDLVPAAPTGEHAADLDWAAHRFRLCRLLGHEMALADLDNATKATLRQFWRQAHPRTSPKENSTVSVLAALDEVFGRALTQLQGLSPSVDIETMRALGALESYCDRTERDVLETVRSACAPLAGDPVALRSMQVLREVESSLEEAMREIRSSGSLLLQESCLPLLDQASRYNSDLIERLSSEGSPEIVAELVTDRLPLLHADGGAFEVVFRVRNVGAMVARNVSLRPQSSECLEFNAEPTVVGDLPAGAERRASVAAGVTYPASSTGFSIEVLWDDDYERAECRTSQHVVEAQRASGWTDQDRNPYQLASIEDPERLIGRAEYIQRYLDIARSGGSMYVTGLKRVGKTSLVRVALTLLQREGHLTVYLPRGRAFGADADAADLVLRMLEKLEDSAADAFPDLEVLAVKDAGDPSNYTRLADRWLGRLRRVLPMGTMAMIALDDFDELPGNLRTGGEADALFLFMRTLIDENWIGVTFIGSEVLPTLLAQQSHRLNQVDPIEVNNFGSRDSTGALLRAPSSDRIDWSDDAVDLVHALTEGNPYYATILGGRVWTALKERDRTLAQQADVERAAERLAASENQSHFLHLWADDPEGLDTASPKAIRSSAVLRALARCSTTTGALVDRSEVIAVSQQWIAGSTTELLQEACSSLVRRGIVHEVDSGQLRLRLPLVGMWLQAAGSRHLDEVYRESALAKPAAKVITAADYRQLARNLTYQSKVLGAIDLEGWVTQLSDPSHQYLAFQLMRRTCTTGFFSQQRVLTQVVPALTQALRSGPLLGREHRATNNYLTRVVVLDSGAAGTSAPVLIRPMLSSLRIVKAAVTSMHDIGTRTATERPRLILVLDEFAGSGRQIAGVVNSLIEKLSTANPRWHEDTTIAVGIGVVPGREAELALGDLPCEVSIGVTLGPEVRAFHPDAGIFDTDADRDAAKDLMSAIGRSLGARPPLGFQDQGLLVVFESNCPNNSLPALWKNGEYSGKPWFPLFERMVGREVAK
jgi:hypothetical protein